MREIVIEKVVVNIGAGQAGDKLQRAEKVLEILTGQSPKRTLSRTTNRDFGIRKAMPIGCLVTLRDEPAVKFLKDAFWVKENRVAGYSFDREGNFSFGIPDYTSFPDQKYDPDIGIFGMDICVTVKRAGRRVRRRKRARGHIPQRHRLNPDLVKDYLRVNFNIEVVEE
jgi:large subunit ribosomal protein L5